jgi:hypothetical protein
VAPIHEDHGNATRTQVFHQLRSARIQESPELGIGHFT